VVENRPADAQEHLVVLRLLQCWVQSSMRIWWKNGKCPSKKV